MKLIVAIIRPEKLEAVQAALNERDVYLMTVSNVRGCGRQRGYTEVYRGTEFQVQLLPRWTQPHEWPAGRGSVPPALSPFTRDRSGVSALGALGTSACARSRSVGRATRVPSPPWRLM